MATLPQITLNFNRKIKLSNDGGSLSSDTGELLFREFDDKIGFFKTLMKHLKLKDNRQFYVHSNQQLLRQYMYQMFAVSSDDDAADHLPNDPVFTQVIETEALASQSILSRLFQRFDNETLEQLKQAKQELLDKIHQHRH